MKSKFIQAAVPVVLGFVAPAVHAAAAELEEVVVTAERREESLQKTKISMTVLDARSIQEAGITEYVQVAKSAPNVIMSDIPTSFGGAISIRGFYNGETIATFEPKVALYVDGVLIGKNAGSAFSVLDLERVEILRGPQGTLYGRNTVGGAVNLITKKPTDKFEGDVMATLGNFSQRDFRTTINVPLLGNSTSSELNLRATIASLKHDGYEDNKYAAGPNKTFADRNRLIGNVQLQWKPIDNLSVLYAFDHTRVDEVNPAPAMTRFNPVTKPTLAPYLLSENQQITDRFADDNQFVKGKVEGHALTIDWKPADHLSLVSISALRKMQYDSSQDADGTPIFVINTNAGDQLKTFTQELRAVGDAFSSRLEYVAGAFYMNEDIPHSYTYNRLPNAGGLSSNIDGSAKNENWAAYGQGTVHLTPRLNLTGGVRYTHEKREMRRTDSNLFTALPALNTITVLPEAGPKGFNDVSGTASLGYQWTDDILTYAKISKGYTSGGFNLRSPSPATFQTGYNAEKVYTYEVGWKTTWLSNRILVNGALFYNDFQDLQVPVLDPATTRNNLVNAATATIEGLELEIQARPTENFDMGLGYGYLSTRYDHYVDPVTLQDLSNVDEFAKAPKHTLNLYGRYVVADFMSAGKLAVRADYAWQSKSALLAAPDNDINAYAVVNARVALEQIKGPGATKFSVAVWAKNLTNKLYYTSGYNLVSSLGFEGRFTGPPRTVGADLEFAF
jgi:iron complex outermembrane recepter protein